MAQEEYGRESENEIVVLSDRAGNKYLLDALAMQDTRVPHERRREVDEALEKGEVPGSAVRLTPTEDAYQMVGSFRLQHAGAVDIAAMLRGL
jgi:hypothetical protein